MRVVEGSSRMGGEGVGDGEHLVEVMYISQPPELTSALGSVSQLGEVKVKPLSVPASMGKAWRERL